MNKKNLYFEKKIIRFRKFFGFFLNIFIFIVIFQEQKSSGIIATLEGAMWLIIIQPAQQVDNGMDVDTTHALCFRVEILLSDYRKTRLEGLVDGVSR